jgi:hypothetical protein
MSEARFLPETRTMPTAPRPGAVAMATMGSWWRASMVAISEVKQKKAACAAL